MLDSEIRLAEDAARALAAAAGTTRLYPEGSPMTAAAVERFVETVARATAGLGPVRYVVDPHGLRFGERTVAAGHAGIGTLAETLYGHQAGQLVVAPGAGVSETDAFLSAIAMDPVDVVASGGIRRLLTEAGVERLAVVELNLHAADEQAGILGLDLTAAPLPEIAAAVTDAAATWQATAPLGDGQDDIGTAVSALELAAQPLAGDRVARALLLLDEATRASLLATALSRDRGGRPMQGALDIVSHLPPAALARLLTAFADGSQEKVASALSALTIPPQAISALEALLSPSPIPEVSCGVPDAIDVSSLAADALAEEPGDAVASWRLVQSATPADSAARAVDTTVAVLRARPEHDSIEALAVAMSGAIEAAAWPAAVRAARELEELGSAQPRFASAVSHAQQALADRKGLDRACREVAEADREPDADRRAAAAQELLAAAGTPAVEALAAAHAGATDVSARRRLAAAACALGDELVRWAGHRLKGEDAVIALAAMELLAKTETHGAAGALARALEHADGAVREASLCHLAEMDDPEAGRYVLRALEHRDPATRRAAARVLGRPGVIEAIDPLVRVLSKREFFERNYELRKQAISSLGLIGSPKALPGLRRMAGRRFVLDGRGRELRLLARQAVEGLEAHKAPRREGMVGS